MTKNLYMVTSKNCLFFVCSDLSAEEIEQAYLTELNGTLYPKSYYNVTVTDLRTINSIRYKGQPVYGVTKSNNNSMYSGLYNKYNIRRGYSIVTEEDLL